LLSGYKLNNSNWIQGQQTEKECGGYRTPGDNRKFTELYNVQRLQSATIGSSCKVVISTQDGYQC
jgi:hypothetical protein